MKKRVLALLLCVTVAFSMTACGSTDGEAVNDTEQETTEEQMPVTDLAKYEFRYSDYVTLADYSAIPVELAEDYEVTREDVETYIEEWFAYYGPFYVEVDKTIIEEGDLADVNYVGKLDGVAFDGGTAENQMIDVSGNCSADGSSGYIEGFTAGLIGAEVGTEVDCNVTFPEDYGNAELAGKEVVFTFTINSIQRKLEYADIDDEFAKEYAGTDTIEEMYEMVNAGLVEENTYYRQADINADVQQYLLNNCKVEIPSDYFADLMQAYRTMFIWNSCDGDETQLEEYLRTNYGLTVEQAEEQWKQDLMTSVKMDFILGAIAEEQGLELDQESYEKELADFISYYGLDSSEPIFESYGYGDLVYGERRMKELHIQSDLLEKIAETVIITIAEPVVEGTETVDMTETVESTEAE